MTPDELVEKISGLSRAQRKLIEMLQQAKEDAQEAMERYRALEEAVRAVDLLRTNPAERPPVEE